MNKHFLVFALLAGAGCASSPSATDAATFVDGGNTAASPDTGSAEDSAAVAGLNGCADASFVDRTTGSADGRMVMVPLGTMTLDQPCMTIRAGQAVMFMWDFTEYPLLPGAAPGQTATGTEPSPIMQRRMGNTYEVGFATAGDYPYYSPSTYDAGMLGVVRVLP